MEKHCEDQLPWLLKTGHLTQSIECLPQSPESHPQCHINPGMVVSVFNPSTWRVRQKESGHPLLHKASLGYRRVPHPPKKKTDDLAWTLSVQRGTSLSQASLQGIDSLLSACCPEAELHTAGSKPHRSLSVRAVPSQSKGCVHTQTWRCVCVPPFGLHASSP